MKVLIWTDWKQSKKYFITLFVPKLSFAPVTLIISFKKIARVKSCLHPDRCPGQ